MQSRRLLGLRTHGTCQRYKSSVLTKSDLKEKTDDHPTASETIPEKRGLPFIGNLIELIMSNGAAQLHKYIDNRHKQLGPIFQEKLGSENCIFVSSANLMRSVFLYEGQYPKHPIPEAWNLYNEKHDCQRGLFFMNGSEWLNNRRLMNKLLLNGNCNWMNDNIEKYTRKCTTQWSEDIDKSGKGFVEINDLERQLYRWSINVLCSIMFGESFDRIDSNPRLEAKLSEFTDNVHKIFTSTTRLMSFPPKLAEALNLKRWTDFEENVDLVLQLGNGIVDEFLKESPCDDGLVLKMKEVDMSLDMIKRIFVDLIIAAGDTTAFSSQWLIYLLSKNEDIQTKVREEIHSSNNWMENPYIKGLIRETLRLYPVAPFIGRYLASDAVIGNYKIDKNVSYIILTKVK
ncbi:CYP315A1 family protein [Megaselia abdita]